MWDEITYPFPNINGCTVDVLECISDVILRFMMDVITYPCWDLSCTGNVSKVGPGTPQELSTRHALCHSFPDSKDHGANMGPTWVLSAPGGPCVGPMNLAIRVGTVLLVSILTITPVPSRQPSRILFNTSRQFIRDDNRIIPNQHTSAPYAYL